MTSSARVAALSIALGFASFALPAFAQNTAPPRPSATPSVSVPTQAPEVQASTAEAKRLSEGFVAVAERVSPSVVQIDVTARDEKADVLAHFFGRNGEDPIAHGMGSGVVFTPDGAILTNNHVVEEALTINVRFRDGRYLPARLLGRDPGTDLALIKVEAAGLTAAKFADSDAARVGESTVAIGSPFGLGYTVTAGVLSAKGRGGLGMNPIEDYLQTDASINPGNSGGPLCNLQGEVLGVNTMIVGRGQGIGFAVPSNMAQRVANQILRTGRVTRPWLGVGVQDLSPELAAAMHVTAGSGALVNNVSPEGPAFKANLRPGDLISSVAGHVVRDGHDLIRETLAHEIGQPLQLEIVRGGQHYGATLTLTERPEPAVEPIPAQQQSSPHQGLGIRVRDLARASKQAAQMQTSRATTAPSLREVMTAGSSADREGMRVGDVIVEANGIANPTSAQVAEAAKSGTLLVRAKRGEAYFTTRR